MDAEYYRQMAAQQQDHWWYRGRRSILQYLIRHYIAPEKSKLILEAGCGPGANLNMLKTFGDVWAFEPDTWAARHAADISGLDVREGGLPAPMPFDGDFDLVCAFDVIEHIEDDHAAMRALYDKTKPGGYALFTVPAHQWLWSAHDDINHHKRRYSRAEFMRLLEGSGYGLKKISYYNCALFPAAALVRLIKNRLGTYDRPDTVMPPAFLNTLLFVIFAAEKFLLRFVNLPFGLSIIVVAQRPQA